MIENMSNKIDNNNTTAWIIQIKIISTRYPIEIVG
jgi:hypothetical protein